MSEWIDVKKELPEKLSYCLVYNIISKLGTGEIAWCFYNSANKWCGENEYYEDVSHWMPLPKPPKEKNKMSDGIVCVNCDEWFDVYYDNKPDNKLRYCPLCGHEFSEKDFEIMNKEPEED